MLTHVASLCCWAQPFLALCRLAPASGPISERRHRFTMAPKRSGKAGNGSRGSAAVAASAKKAPAKRKSTNAPASLLEQPEHDEPSSCRNTKALRRRDTDEAVQKSIRDTFPKFDHLRTDVVLHEGVTLRERLTNDKRRSKDGSLSMGATYYRNLRQWYDPQDGVLSKLQVNVSTEPVRPTVMAALVAFKARPAERGPLTEWLRTSSAGSQRELVGVFKAILELRAGISKQQCNLIIDCMRWVTRNNIHASFPSECAAMKAHWDDALTQAFANLKKEGLSGKMFWELYSPVVHLVTPPEPIGRLMQATGRWLDHQVDIEMVIASSMVGKRMFMFAHALIVKDRVTEIMAAASVLLEGLPMLDKAAVAEQRSVALARVNALAGLDLLPSRRDIVISYRGIPTSLQVFTIGEEFELRCSAVVKARGVQAGLLVPLRFEQGLVDPGVKQASTHMHIDLLKEANIARATANDILGQSTDEVIDGAEAAARLAKKTGGLVTKRQELQARGGCDRQRPERGGGGGEAVVGLHVRHIADADDCPDAI